MVYISIGDTGLDMLFVSETLTKYGVWQTICPFWHPRLQGSYFIIIVWPKGDSMDGVNFSVKSLRKKSLKKTSRRLSTQY